MITHRARMSEDDRDVCAHLVSLTPLGVIVVPAILYLLYIADDLQGETLTEDEKTMDALLGIQAGLYCISVIFL